MGTKQKQPRRPQQMLEALPDLQEEDAGHAAVSLGPAGLGAGLHLGGDDGEELCRLRWLRLSELQRSSSNVREGFKSLVIDANDALAVETRNILVTNLNYSFLNSSLCATFQIGCTV